MVMIDCNKQLFHVGVQIFRFGCVKSKDRTYAKPFILRSDTRPRVSLLARGRANSAIFA